MSGWERSMRRRWGNLSRLLLLSSTRIFEEITFFRLSSLKKTTIFYALGQKHSTRTIASQLHMNYVLKLSKRILFVLKFYQSMPPACWTSDLRVNSTTALTIWWRTIAHIPWVGSQWVPTTSIAKSTKLPENTSKRLSFWIRASFLHGSVWLTPSLSRMNLTKLCQFTGPLWDYSQDAHKPTSTWACSTFEPTTSKRPLCPSKKPRKSTPVIPWFTPSWESSTTSRRTIRMPEGITSWLWRSAIPTVLSGWRKPFSPTWHMPAVS